MAEPPSERRAKNLQRVRIELQHVSENPSGVCRFSYIKELRQSICRGCDFSITEISRLEPQQPGLNQ